MVVMAYKWGGIAFDDKALIKTLILPSDASSGTEITFHDEEGNDYQVPVGKVFIAGVLAWGTVNTAVGDVAYEIGESAGADGVLTKSLLSWVHGNPDGSLDYLSGWNDVMAVFAATKYVTATSQVGGRPMSKGTALYGVEIDA